MRIVIEREESRLPPRINIVVKRWFPAYRYFNWMFARANHPVEILIIDESWFYANSD